ncbi:hypothetical protein PVAND_004530 [Polypedilum vanderplanki]|uniref:Uncharacterized protein n=1 Tax=Polypedilum vanderplanki TaxID=319348 RepID=A0A9J6BY08_POLVA|nr:hypothetical protein PVAND_004530 [Polypedilum vanderplanki]
MANAVPRQNSNELQTNETAGTDEVEKSLELLDKVLSEFEEEQDKTQAGEPESPSQGHQSEDDGYMSMNGRRAKFVPDFLPTEEAISAHSIAITTTSLPLQDGPLPPDEKFSPPTPEEAERIISHLLPQISSISTQEDLNKSAMPCIEFKFLNNNCNINTTLSSNLSFGTKLPATIDSEASSALNSLTSTTNAPPHQTTLPKTRPTVLLPSRYASLPSSIQKPIENDQQQPGNIYIGREFIGIKINDVHNAVLKSGARMPETIVNEHPVTIYPGPLPQKRVPPRTLPGSIERHREVIRKNPSSELSSPSSSSLSPQEELMKSPIKELKSPVKSNSSSKLIILGNDSDEFIKRPLSPKKSSSACNSPTNATTLGIKISIQTMDNLMNNRNIMKIEQKMNMKNIEKNHHLNVTEDDDEDKFSDDSLEDTSLPPPAPPPIFVPPPPSLSAPVTPSKRHSIAWEVNLDDLCSNGNGSSGVGFSTKVIGRKQQQQGNNKMLAAGSESQSQSSICSTPGQSSASNKVSSDWPDPPDIPICSTEDEAASLYSDSDDHIIDPGTEITDGHATYVIRKGRRRQRIDEFGSISMSSINSKLSNEVLCNDSSNPALNVPSPVFPPSMLQPQSRHSIDLGASPRKHILPHNNYHTQSTVMTNSPRSRLSLDLNSPKKYVTTTPTSSCLSTPTTTSTKSPSFNKIITTPTSPMVTNSNSFSSPRYTEFKTYSSTFDGLQALENHTNTTNGNNSNILMNGSRVSTQVNNNNINTSPDNNPLMRVSSLPAIPPQNSLMTTGDLTSTPRRELAPPIEEDEEDSDGTKGAPLRQIENNISALLRGDIAVAQVPAISRPLGFRPGVHKSESAKEMLLSQQYFGPLPATPPSSPEADDSDEFPPLPHTPPSPDDDTAHGIQNISISSRGRIKADHGYRKEHRAPAVPPHAAHSTHSYELKTRSMDAGFSSKSYRNGSSLQHSPGPGHTLPPDLSSVTSTSSSRRRLASSGFPKRSAQSPREERRLQTSCSLPETPIFARGCDIPRGTPHRRAAPDPPPIGSSRTNPRQNSLTLNSSSIVGIGCTTIGSTGRTHRSINHALQANGELMRMTGLPARGWYPKQRHTRTTASTEHLDRLHQSSMRAWETNSGKRKPTTLPPNMTPPKFFNSKSPRDALRRVTSLLINRKGNSSSSKEKEKEEKTNKREKNKNHHDNEILMSSHVHRSPRSLGDIEPPQQPKKKGFFKSFWKKSRHYSLEQN